MGFFKKLVKGVGKGLKAPMKMLSVKNIGKAVDGKWSDLGREAVGRTKDALVKGVTGEFTKKTVKKASPAGNLPTSKRSQLEEALLAAAGGAAIAVGNQLTNNQGIAEQMANAGDNVAMAWIKKNWLKVVGAVAAAVVIGVVLKRVLTPKKRRYSGR